MQSHSSSSARAGNNRDLQPHSNFSYSNTSTKRSKTSRVKYSRPCDLCAARKVRCDRLEKAQRAQLAQQEQSTHQTPSLSPAPVSCTRCLKNGVPCTNSRFKKKCGPKPHKKLSPHPESNHHQSSQSVYNTLNERPSLSNSDSSSASGNLFHHASLTSQTLLHGSHYTDHDHNNYSDSQSQSNLNNSNQNMHQTARKVWNTTNEHILTLDKLLPCLQVYQTWYYGVWPVISVAHLVSEIAHTCTSDALTSENATSYALCCAISAAISKQITFLSSKSHIVSIPTQVQAFDYVSESLRARSVVDYKLNPSYESLLTSFFLYVYYINIKGGTNASILYLREAISMAQILGLHNPSTYLSKTAAEVHRLRKIYYLLLVTERFMCIEDNMPVVLDASIPYPSLEDEEYPSLLTGFVELVKIFAIPDRSFFENMSNLSDNEMSSFKILKDFMGVSSGHSTDPHSTEEPETANDQCFHYSGHNPDLGFFDQGGKHTSKDTVNSYKAEPKREDSKKSLAHWIVSVQNKLTNIDIVNPTSDIQKVNILLSKHWMRSLTWHIAYQNGVLRKSNSESRFNCLSFNYPVEIAYDFLSSTKELPIYAFESNGPGVCVKLLEIANGLADFINDLSFSCKFDDFATFNALTSIFNLVGKFKTDVTLPLKLYQKIETILSKRPIPRMPEPSGSCFNKKFYQGANITELKQGEDSSNIEQQIIDSCSLSPFTELVMAMPSANYNSGSTQGSNGGQAPNQRSGQLSAQDAIFQYHQSNHQHTPSNPVQLHDLSPAVPQYGQLVQQHVGQSAYQQEQGAPVMAQHLGALDEHFSDTSSSTTSTVTMNDGYHQINFFHSS